MAHRRAETDIQYDWPEVVSYVVDVDADTGVVLLDDLGGAESSRLTELLTP